MATWGKLGSECLSALVAINGEGSIGVGGSVSGRRLPRTSAIDALTVLAKLSPGLVGAVSKISMDGRAWRVGVADGDGIARADTIAVLALRSDGGLDAKAYVAGYAHPLVPYQRSKAAATAQGVVLLNTSPLYEPVLAAFALGGEDTALLSALRQSMHDWQRAVAAATALALAVPGDLSAMQTGPGVESFWRAVLPLTSGMDVIAEQPITDRFEVLKGALGAGTKASAEFVATNAGELAAYTAELAGETAGTFADAFFSNAGLTAMIVAGLAVYMVLP